MSILEYLAKHKISRREFATVLGVSRSLVDHMINGTRRPSGSLAKLIHEVTSGEVPKHELRPDLWSGS